MNTLRYNNCPLCHSSNILRKGLISYSTPVLFSTYEVTITEMPELWKCRNCGSGFVQSIFPEENAARFYSDGSSCERWPHEPIAQTKPREIVDALTSIFNDGAKVLDIGCNTGALLDYAKSRGCTTSGVEFSKKSIETLVDKGHAPFQSISELHEPFDVITAFDLVEHLYDVPGFLDSCYNRLKPNGALVILTGDIMSLSARMTQANWWYVRHPEHIVFPSKKFFKLFTRFHVDFWIHTYASLEFKTDLSIALRKYIGTLLPGRTYAGLPSLGPDHILAVLRK